MENSNLLWEINGYEPIIIFSLEPVARHTRSSLSHDMSHFHYFMESQFGLTDVRASDFTSCKSLLKSQLDVSLLIFRALDWDDNPEFVYKLKTFNCYT